MNISIIRGFYYIIVSIINIFLFKYTSDLEKEKCACSKSWMRTYIKVFSLIIPSMLLLILIFGAGLNKYFITRLLYILYSLSSLIYVGVLFAFYLKLKCDCSNNWKKSLLLYPLIVLVPIVFLVLIKTALDKDNFKIDMKVKK